MTTDQIRAANTHFVDTITHDDAVAAAEEEATQIVAKARYEAFRMVTDARAEAEAILAEATPSNALGGEPEASSPASDELSADDTSSAEDAHAIVAEASEQASTMIEQARIDADSIVANAEARFHAEHATLLDEHAELEQKVENTRSVLAALEARLAAIARTPSQEPTLPDPPIAPIGSDTADSTETRAPGRKAMRVQTDTPRADTEESSGDGLPGDAPADDRGSKREPVPAPAIDYAPSVPAPVAVEEVEVTEEGETGRGSFYSRRSAKLPSIGESAGQEALGAMRSLRLPVEP